MKKIILILTCFSLLLMLASCGEKPGSLRKLDDVVPEFTKRLNHASKTGEYTNLMKIFDQNAIVLLNTEFNPEVMQGHSEILDYFSSMPAETQFTTSEVELSNLWASTEYTFIQPNGKTGSGSWQFKLNNMGKISELTIVPGEDEGE